MCYHSNYEFFFIFKYLYIPTTRYIISLKNSNKFSTYTHYPSGTSVTNTGELTHKWFKENLTKCAKEGSCNFTTLGGILEKIGVVKYVKRGMYSSNI